VLSNAKADGKDHINVRLQSKGALLKKIERFKLDFTRMLKRTRYKMRLEKA